jgi:hypothetical protein
MKGLNSACFVLASTEGCLRLEFESHSMMEKRMESTGSRVEKRHGSEKHMKTSMALDHRYHIIDSSMYIDYEVTEEEIFGMEN